MTQDELLAAVKGAFPTLPLAVARTELAFVVGVEHQGRYACAILTQEGRFAWGGDGYNEGCGDVDEALEGMRHILKRDRRRR